MYLLLKKWPCVLLVIILLVFVACDKDQDYGPNSPEIITGAQIGPIIANTVVPKKPQPIDPAVYTSIGNETTEERSCECFQVQFRPNNPYWNQYAAFSEDYLGRLYDGALLAKGIKKPLNNVKLKPYNYSISLQGIAGAVADRIENPNLSTFTTSLKNLVSQKITGQTGGGFQKSVERIESEMQIRKTLNVEADFSLGRLGLNFDFNLENISETKSSKVLASFNQNYFTATMDDVTDAEYGIEALDIKQLEGGNMPARTKQIVLGRAGVVTFESTVSSSTLESAVSSYFKFLDNDISAEFTSKKREILENSRISVLIIGGNNESNVRVVDLKTLDRTIEAGANYGPESPAVVTAVKYEYVDGTTLFREHIYNYEVKECTPLPDSAHINFRIDRYSVFSQLVRDSYLEMQRMYYQERGNGGCDFNGRLTNRFSFELVIENKTELWLNLKSDLVSLLGNAHGQIIHRKMIYSAPGEKLKTELKILTGDTWNLQSTKSNFNVVDRDHAINPVQVTGGGPVVYVEFNGDTEGDDLCGSDTVGNSQAWLSVKEFRAIDLLIVTQPD